MDALTVAIGYLMERISGWFSRARRFSALFDRSAWLLIAPALAILCWIDPAMMKTVLQWSGIAVILAGLACIVSRIIFPQIHLGELVEAVKADKSLPAAVVVAALVMFVAALIIALVLWAKA